MNFAKFKFTLSILFTINLLSAEFFASENKGQGKSLMQHAKFYTIAILTLTTLMTTTSDAQQLNNIPGVILYPVGNQIIEVRGNQLTKRAQETNKDLLDVTLKSFSNVNMNELTQAKTIDQQYDVVLKTVSKPKNLSAISE
jgi:hypothetical protein